jgi:ribosome-binding protein aMBF1 (putative translation factor)
VHAGLRHLKHQQQSLRLSGPSRAVSLHICKAYQQSQASNALQQSAQLSQQQQQQQQQQQSAQEAEQSAFDAERHQHIVEDYDLTYW